MRLAEGGGRRRVSIRLPTKAKEDGALHIERRGDIVELDVLERRERNRRES